ncbi:MAG: 3-deoxy-7-phosphoheptulonate synthase [Deltaproteobacteria bacterium]
MLTDDLRIKELKELVTPETVMNEIPLSAISSQTVVESRAAIRNILRQNDDRLLVVIGPCSIHDPVAALNYAQRLKALRDLYASDLEIVMRVYFEKPRTTVGWKGLINDPALNGTFDINRGLRVARKLLSDINDMGVPAGTEYLDMTTPQYIEDLVAWGAIGARTTESQFHRELASGLSCPVGFKNGTSGDVKIAVDAVQSAKNPHHFLAVTKTGRSAIATTTGNDDCHIILRGGIKTNYDAESVDNACKLAERSGERGVVMVDASHANSLKKHDNQPLVCADIATQMVNGEDRIIGVMVESNLVAGAQKITENLTYGQSVTDACIGWETTETLLKNLAEAVRIRRNLRPALQEAV